MRDYEGTSLDSLRQMVGSGIGLAIMPEFYLRSESTGENMVTRLTPNSWSVKRSIAMAWRRGAANESDYRQLAERIRTIGLSRLQSPFLK
jgi:LysR family hydrogen peroxide-inducible transcriptional activator